MGHEFEKLSGDILEAATHAHRTLGPGFVEPIYQSALGIAFQRRGIIYEPQKEIAVLYEGELVGTHRLDFLVDDTIVVELKAVQAFDEIHFAQLKSYLKAAQKRVGLLLNFNAAVLSVKRFVL